MFSVDNFYTFMNSHYGLESDGRNLLYFFQPHGSKNWKDLVSGFIENEHLLQNRSFYDSKGAIILHDQEPFDQIMLDTYKKHDTLEKKEKWRTNQPLDEVFLSRHISIGWPIFCHSESNSLNIEWIKQAGGIPCHYFWHGLIARDWFRHWRHHGWISVDKPWQYRFLLYARDFTGTRQYRSQLINDLSSIKKQVSYNWNKSQIIPADYSATISELDAQSSAIHLVAETLFGQEKTHLTEKVFKPMVMMQPFILFAGSGALAYLKNYGFKTFDHIWDESYDLILDPHDRYQKILSLIKYLSKLDKKTFCKKLEQTKSVVQHNHERFFSLAFEKQMLAELHENMAFCLDQQTEKIKRFPGGAAFYVLEKRLSRGINPIEHKKRLRNLLVYLKVTDAQRYQDIIKQNAWLRKDFV